MNRNEFNRFVAGIDLPGPGDLEGLRELTALFPWFHSAHLVLLKGLRANSDIRFDSQLKASALSVSDREVLYHYLFLSPDETSPEAESPAGEEVVSTVSELAPDEPDDIRDSAEIPAEVEVVEIPAEVEVVVMPAETEEIMPPEESEELLTPQEAGEILMPEEAEEISAPEEVEEMTPPEEDDEIPAPAKTGEILSPEEEEGILSPEEADEISAPLEAEDMLMAEEKEVRDEGQAEELPGPEVPEAEADANTELRTREELVAEIEARLRELESYRQVTVEEQIPEIVDETVPAVETEPEIEEPPALTPEIIEPPAPEPEPEIEEPPAPETEPEAEEETMPEPGELLELIPDTVAEVETPEKKLSPADLIDRFIMISPTIERMSPKEYQPVRDLTEQGSDEPGKFITETLAKIYVNQGYYTRAINIYEKLALQYPEKSAYFASRIEKIKDLIK